MELTQWKWVSRVIPRKRSRPKGSDPTGKAGSALRPLWLNSKAVQAAEQCAEAAGVPVARFIDGMLFEICGASPPVKKRVRGMNKPEARAAQVIRIDRRNTR